MITFFVSWQLWQQIAFVLLVFLVITLGVGLTKNMLSWQADNWIIKMLCRSVAGRLLVPQDIEAYGMAIMDEVPFGVKALQQGVEVDGIWISLPNTPDPGSPVMSMTSSLAPSKTGGTSSQTITSRVIPSQELIIENHGVPYSTSKTSRLSGLAIDSVPSSNAEGEYYDYEYASTLDALEGRHQSVAHNQDDTQRYYSRSSLRSRSGVDSPRSDGGSTFQSSLSPPTLTDGASQSDALSSTDMRPSLLSYLSESNHRLSHVAETGRLHPRIRPSNIYDSINATGDVTSSGKSHLHASLPRKSGKASRTFSDRTRHTPDFRSADQPLRRGHEQFQHGVIDQTNLDPFLQNGPPVTTYSSRHSRAISCSQAIAGQQPTPILVEYMSRSYIDEYSSPTNQATTYHDLGGHETSCAPCHGLSPVNHTAPPPQPIFSKYRDSKMKSGFTSEHESMEPLNAPLTRPLELPPLGPHDFPTSERRKSKKLQKKRP